MSCPPWPRSPSVMARAANAGQPLRQRVRVPMQGALASSANGPARADPGRAWPRVATAHANLQCRGLSVAPTSALMEAFSARNATDMPRG